jgi:hypothetical protein
VVVVVSAAPSLVAVVETVGKLRKPKNSKSPAYAGLFAFRDIRVCRVVLRKRFVARFAGIRIFIP